MKRAKNIYLWTGNGWGKTTSALGVALRAIGHGHKVIIIQFMKGRRYIGEYKIRKRLRPHYNIYQFGRERFVNLKNPSKKDKELARKGFEFIKEAIKQKPKLLILDEINLATAIGLLDINEVIDMLNKIPKNITVYLTGRYAPKKLMDRADYVTEIRAIRHPPIGKRAKKGIDY
ncbi:MAG: cob(I)yrinic acid a,c-diamide adenosyltransferase [Candidatus Woesearchaeota archaeon]|nr:cob(I)yrinic acid a,c-diamide adenosyltransferase [Candidatus Woesearchaeota archaeon]